MFQKKDPEMSVPLYYKTGLSITVITKPKN